MPVKKETTNFADEVKIISPVAWVIAVIGFVGILCTMVLATIFDKRNPPGTITLMAPLGVFVGAAVACIILLIGYINRDAGRRGMSRTVWTLLAIFIPNALGIVLYFILRKPRIAHCPQCGTALEPGFGFCPSCRYRLSPVCGHCQRAIHAGDKFCPYCGADLGAASEPAAKTV
jgi:RNA polymerase subunit RPABC4/transcription elongation factor Spt4